MANDPIPYDASRTALYAPERSAPTPDFSIHWKLEQICAELSRLAYYRFERGDGPRLDAALAKAGFSSAATFDVSAAGAQAFATSIPDGSAFVAFRGTQPGNVRDAAANSRANLVEFGDGAKVHAGFLAAWHSIAEPVGRWIAAAGDRPLVFTGHSLGAAMATLAAASHPDSRVISFGSPRVGNAVFAASFARREVRRYVDCTDLVTSVPPPLLGYTHVGDELYVDRLGTVHEAALPPAAIGEDRRLARRSYLTGHAWKVWRNVAVRDLADHAPVNYISAVLGRRSAD